MSRNHIFRCVMAVLASVALLVSSVLFVQGAEGLEFSLSHAQVSVNRLFEVTLSAKGEYSLSAFIAELIYDPDVLRYDSAFVQDDVQYSVNSLEAGKLTVVYLDEDGASCTDSTALMSFKFKALAEGNTEIKLSVRDAITPESTDISVLRCTSSQITVLSLVHNDKSGNKAVSNEKSTSEVFDVDEEGNSFIKGVTNIGGVPVSNQTIVSVVLSFLCTLCVAVYIAYKIGAHRQKEKLKPAPLAFKDKAGNDELSH